MSAEEPSQGANCAPRGQRSGEAAKRAGIMHAPKSRLKARIASPKGQRSGEAAKRGGIMHAPKSRLKARIAAPGGQRSGEATMHAPYDARAVFH
jgi:hypothetical protein